MNITWTVHRARENLWKTIIVGIFILLFLIFTVFTFGLLLACVAFLVIAGATHTYFLPITYTLNNDGITIDKRIYRYTYEWSRFRRFFITTGGVVLSPFEKPSFLDNFRGVHLLLPEEHQEIIGYLKNRFREKSDIS